jgi:hypothetical protein
MVSSYDPDHSTRGWSGLNHQQGFKYRSLAQVGHAAASFHTASIHNLYCTDQNV